MRERITKILSRVQYAAMGAAIGAGIGGLFSRNMASTGAAFGALVGATYGEKRPGLADRFEELTDADIPTEKLPSRD